MKDQQYYIDKLFAMPEKFNELYTAKEWAQAKYIYDTALRVAIFFELPEEEKIKLFGNYGYDDREDKPMEGLFANDKVIKVDEECCVMQNKGFENMHLRHLGEPVTYYEE